MTTLKSFVAEKQKERDTIAEQIKQFQAKGGKIDVIASTVTVNPKGRASFHNSEYHG